MHSLGRSRTPRCSAAVPLAASLRSSWQHLALSPLRAEPTALRQPRETQQLVPNKCCAGARTGRCCNEWSVISKEKMGNLQKIQQTSQLSAQTSWAAQPLRSLPKHQGGARNLLRNPGFVLWWSGREASPVRPSSSDCLLHAGWCPTHPNKPHRAVTCRWPQYTSGQQQLLSPAVLLGVTGPQRCFEAI